MNHSDGRTPTVNAAGGTFRRARGPLAVALLLLIVVCCLFGGTASARAAVPGKPTAKAPKGKIASATPTFTWTKAKRAVKYEVRVFKGTTQLVRRKGITTPSWKCTKVLTKNVALTWKVRGVNGKRVGSWSKSVSFKVVTIKVGDSYQGGIVAYIFAATDPGYVAGETHGLIAAVGDSSSMGIRWSNGSSVDDRGDRVPHRLGQGQHQPDHLDAGGHGDQLRGRSGQGLQRGRLPRLVSAEQRRVVPAVRQPGLHRRRLACAGLLELDRTHTDLGISCGLLQRAQEHRRQDGPARSACGEVLLRPGVFRASARSREV